MITSISRVNGDEALATRMPRPPNPPIARRLWFKIIGPLAFLVVIAIAWEVVGYNLNPVLLSSPQQVASDFVGLFKMGTAEAALAISARELYIGLSIGLVAGVLAGMALGRYRIAEAIFLPYVNSANATPLNVLIPLLVVWVGISAKARILFVVLLAFFPVLLNTSAGIRNVSRGYVEVGKMLGLNERQLLRKVILPGSVPYIFAGLRISVALAVIGMIVGEMEVSNVGLGYLLLYYGQSFQTGKMLALVFLAALLGVGNVMVVRGIQARWFKWTTRAH